MPTTGLITQHVKFISTSQSGIPKLHRQDQIQNT